ncbi:MAG: hypothetical protein RLZZ490_1476 [Cyanobacteriota bacterium]
MIDFFVSLIYLFAGFTLVSAIVFYGKIPIPKSDDWEDWLVNGIGACTCIVLWPALLIIFLLFSVCVAIGQYLEGLAND